MWNYDLDLYIIDLYNFEYKVLHGFFDLGGEEDDSRLSPLIYVSNLRRQSILAYFGADG